MRLANTRVALHVLGALDDHCRSFDGFERLAVGVVLARPLRVDDDPLGSSVAVPLQIIEKRHRAPSLTLHVGVAGLQFHYHGRAGEPARKRAIRPPHVAVAVEGQHTKTRPVARHGILDPPFGTWVELVNGVGVHGAAPHDFPLRVPGDSIRRGVAVRQIISSDFLACLGVIGQELPRAIQRHPQDVLVVDSHAPGGPCRAETRAQCPTPRSAY